MSFVIRPAMLADAAGIAQVIDAALRDVPDLALIARVLGEADHVTVVAEADAIIAGFASGFLTWDALAGCWRWELDLLGVRPDFQGRGAGRQLIAACTQAGQHLMAPAAPPRTARGLVAAHNAASQKAFAYAGYESLPQPFALYIATEGVQEMPVLPETAHLICVTTLTYRGVWIEGQITPLALRTALAVQTRQGLYSAGAVIPMTDEPARQFLQAAGFTLLGAYHWWQRTYTCC